ncbi:MAG: dephospho-CoA kinase [Anaerolineae bacterium]|jgi:dephospho-CoA kinase
MYVIGLTGNIATGKTLVLERLAFHGAFCVDADKVAHEVMRREGPAWAQIRDRFGDAILDRQGEIHRPALAQVVFSDPDELRALEEIVHPHVIERVDALLAASGAAVGVVEAIKLIESGMNERCHALWVTTSSNIHQMRRLMRERNLSSAEARARIEAQPAPGTKVSQADVLIQNEGTKADVFTMVDEEWREIEAKRAPGQSPGPEAPYQAEGAWHIWEGCHHAVAVPTADGRWRLLASTETRMPRLFRPLVRALAIYAASRWQPHPGLLVPRRTGYCQFLEGLGFEEAQENGAEPGEALYYPRYR